MEATLWRQADELGGGDKAWLIIDDIDLAKKARPQSGPPRTHGPRRKLALRAPFFVVMIVRQHRSGGCDASTVRASPWQARIV